MKITHIIALAVASLGLISCGDEFFEQYPSNNVTEGNFYQTEADFNQGVYACYAKLKTQSGFHITELSYRTEECILESMAVSTQDRYDIDHFAENASNGILSDIWNAWYNGIYRCNDVLDHAAGKDFPKLAQYKAEALFIRSWYYFNLWRCFGGVPVVKTVATPAEAKLVPRCTAAAMYEMLVEDLTYAINNLPATRSAEKARVTKIAAQALLGKVHLTFGEYYEAELVLADAMTDSNFGLMPTTGDAFNVANKMNKEILFALYYNKSNDNGHGYWYSSNTAVEADRRNPTPEFQAIFAANDNRLPLINTYRKITNAVYAMTKWDDTYDATYTTQVGNDFPHLRYADVVLMRAEALAQQNKIGDAVTYLNMTRKRAGLSDASASDFADKKAFLVELGAERGREFALEGQRWFDLVRLGLAVEHFRAQGHNIGEHNLLFPIPNAQIEIVNNKDILWQNPGF